MIFAGLHVCAVSLEAHAFDLQQEPLLETALAGEQDSSSAAKYTLPRNPFHGGFAQRPGYLPRGPRVTCRLRDRAVRRDSAPRDASHRFLNILEIAQSFTT